MNARRGIGARRPRARQRGIAFLLVLWVVAMLSILLGSFAMIARTENLQARHLFDTAQARYAAEAGLNLAVYELRKNDPLQRWVGDGRPYVFAYGDAEIEVRINDDSGKLDINSIANGDPKMLERLFTSHGVPLEQAQALADAVADWVDPDDDTRLNGAEIAQYKAAGLSYGPRNAPFDTISELQQVLGMNYELYTRLEPALTIYSGRSAPDVGFANYDAILAQDGMTPECAQQIVEAQQAMQPGDAAAPQTICDVTLSGVASSGGLTYSVKSRAKLPNGASTTLDATIRMGGINPAGRPYVILRWRDGETS